ncbi:hypothetical protein E2C01_059798 [Portunus trituberculatus]|uniref:Uncharacterized protein n=1 Tax=Portunus trituberculatus TaxID=210409 RepID=A0A5B7H0C1_PORTR|nr:hypothetical protein [Portunus trituberculatus]
MPEFGDEGLFPYMVKGPLDVEHHNRSVSFLVQGGTWAGGQQQWSEAHSCVLLIRWAASLCCCLFCADGRLLKVCQARYLASEAAQHSGPKPRLVRRLACILGVWYPSLLQGEEQRSEPLDLLLHDTTQNVLPVRPPHALMASQSLSLSLSLNCQSTLFLFDHYIIIIFNDINTLAVINYYYYYYY